MTNDKWQMTNQAVDVPRSSSVTGEFAKTRRERGSRTHYLSCVICHLSFRRASGEPGNRRFPFILPTVRFVHRPRLAFSGAGFNSLNAYGRSTDYCCRRVY